MHSSTVENYLKSIHRLSGDSALEKRVALGQIAEDLSVTPGTVTSMMKHLADRNLVDYQRRQGVSLTPQGVDVALHVLRRHRLVELFLVEVMGLDWADVHEDAETLEHVISNRMLDRMDEMLGFPTRDPHGAPIPSADGILPRAQSKPLSECTPGPYRILRITDNATEFLNWLKENQLLPGTRIEMLSLNPYAETITLQCESRVTPLQLSIHTASKLLVIR